MNPERSSSASQAGFRCFVRVGSPRLRRVTVAAAGSPPPLPRSAFSSSGFRSTGPASPPPWTFGGRSTARRDVLLFPPGTSWGGSGVDHAHDVTIGSAVVCGPRHAHVTLCRPPPVLPCGATSAALQPLRSPTRRSGVVVSLPSGATVGSNPASPHSLLPCRRWQTGSRPHGSVNRGLSVTHTPILPRSHVFNRLRGKYTLFVAFREIVEFSFLRPFSVSARGHVLSA